MITRRLVTIKDRLVLVEERKATAKQRRCPQISSLEPLMQEGADSLIEFGNIHLARGTGFSLEART